MSTKKTITHGDEYHIYQEIFEDENIYLQIDKHGGYVCINNDRITVSLSPSTLDEIANSWIKNRDKISVENP